MPETLNPTLDLARDAGLALTDAGYAYGLLIAAIAPLTLAGLLVVAGLIATHGKSHGTRFSAMAVFAFASLAALAAWLIRPDAAAGTTLGALLPWAWLPPLIAGLSIFITMPEKPKPRAAGLAFTTLLALCATAFAGMVSVANERALHPDSMTWLDAPPAQDDQGGQAESDQPGQVVEVLDTARDR